MLHKRFLRLWIDTPDLFRNETRMNCPSRDQEPREILPAPRARHRVKHQARGAQDHLSCVHRPDVGGMLSMDNKTLKRSGEKSAPAWRVHRLKRMVSAASAG
jgi:hypothetical protein